ncbi:MAG: hypothetical protein ABI356_15375 [Steroidobacteraceae bacterium]
MPNGNESKNPPPPPLPPGSTGPGAAKPNDGGQSPPQTELRRAAGVGGAVGSLIGSLIGALIGCCFCLHHLN